MLVDAVQERLGRDAIAMNYRSVGVEQDDTGVTVHFVDATSGQALPPVHGAAAIAARDSLADPAPVFTRMKARPPTRASTCGAA